MRINQKIIPHKNSVELPAVLPAGIFGLPSEAGKPGLLKEAGVAPIRGKTIRIARALLVTVGSEGSNRK